jgi:ligand-binding sensor domain-containing protein/DNA-binding CsgD family transcriptional regulator
MCGRKLILLSGLLILELFVSAQIKEIGLPFVNHYFRDEYNAGTQNWSIAKDSAGLMYFANNNGVLRFDGTNWDLYRLPNNSKVRCVSWIGNKLYAGGYEEFGYLTADDRGFVTYTSLTDQLEEEDQKFDEIWRIFETPHGIVFQSFIRLFLLKNDGISVITPKSRFGFSYYSADDLFVIDRDFGLYLLASNGMDQIYADPFFFKENEIAFIIDTGLNGYLLGTTNNGIYQLNGAGLKPWSVRINERFMKEQIYTGLKLNSEQMAIGTTQNGVYIIDFNGEIIQHLNRSKGLQNNTVLSMYQDDYDNLWLGLDNGIDALEFSSPITAINYAYGIETSYTSIVYGVILYIGTNQGLFAKPLAEIENRFAVNEEFQLVEGVVGQVWALGQFNGKLLCGNNLGTFVVDGYDSYQISDRRGGWTYVDVPGRKDKVIGGTYTGLQVFTYSAGSREGWSLVQTVKGFDESSRELMFDDNNNLWIAHEYKGIFKLRLSEDWLSVDSVRLYAGTSGLPDLPYSISKLDGEFVLTAANGLYAYDQKLDSFLLHETYHLLLGNEKGLTKVIEDDQGDIWYFTQENMGVLRKQEDGSYVKITKPFRRIQNQFLGSTFENVYVHDGDHVFIGGELGMLHYNPNKQKDFELGFSAYIGEVLLKGRSADSIISGGLAETTMVEIPYRFNSLSFRYFSPYYEAPGYISYSYRLAGFDEGWSPWESRNMKEYTNLHEGDYEFMVKAKNVYDNISGTSSLKISIAPPPHRTKLAFAIYVAAGLLVVILIVFLVRKRIHRTRDQEKARHAKEMQAKEEFYLEGAKLSEQEIERLKREKLIIEMRHKDMELANSTMYLVQKNKFLNKIKNEIQDLIGKLTTESNKYALRQIVQRIDRDIKSRQHWKVFDQYFDEVHEDFIARLKEKHPDLTPKELRLCAYLKMNISTKEIAPLMNISVRGVEISRYRLRKKLALDKGINLTEYILSL